MTKIKLKSAPIHASPCSMSKRCVSLARFAHRGVLPPLPGLVGFPAVTGAGTALGRDCVSANEYHFTKMGCDIHCQGVGTLSSAEQTGHHPTETGEAMARCHRIFVQVRLAVRPDQCCCCCSKNNREIPTLKSEGLKASAQDVSGTQAQASISTP